MRRRGRQTMPMRWVWWIPVVLVLVVTIAVVTIPSEADPREPADPGTAAALLAELPVKGSAPANDYDRVGHFGESWIDVDGNGCDTRNDILQRDLTDLVLDGPCIVLAGEFADPYTGDRIAFERGVDTSQRVQIDHVVALKDAWRTGAQDLPQERRIALANDPINLRAADGSANGQKGDRNAASWLPSNTSFRCEYVARQVSTKAAYDLWVVPAEKDAMERVLAACPDQPAFVSEGPTASVSYRNCAAVREAGAAPIRRGDPGYASHLDRDGDGIGCA